MSVIKTTCVTCGKSSLKTLFRRLTSDKNLNCELKNYYEKIINTISGGVPNER